MLPEQERKLNEIYEWMLQKKRQQITMPLDDASRILLGAITYDGAGSTAKTQVYTDSNSDTVTAPKAYTGTLLLVIEGVRYEVPYIATP